jgi:hypothetical protein
MTTSGQGDVSRSDARTEAEAIDFAWKIHSALTDWTGKVDAKASFALAVESAGIAASISLTAKDRTFGNLQTAWQIASLWTAICLLLTAAVLAVVVVTPRLRRGQLDVEVATNFIYFGHLRHWHGEDLRRALMHRPLLPVLTTQLINMSKIAWRKHRLAQASLTLAAIAAAVLLVLATTA